MKRTELKQIKQDNAENKNHTKQTITRKQSRAKQSSKKILKSILCITTLPRLLAKIGKNDNKKPLFIFLKKIKAQNVGAKNSLYFCTRKNFLPIG